MKDFDQRLKERIIFWFLVAVVLLTIYFLIDTYGIQ